LAVRMRAMGIKTLSEYNNLLRQDPEEFERLLDRLTINVSHFFRDPATYKSVAQRVVPQLNGKSRIRIWSAGCANGEEPYSLAMLFKENLPSTAKIHILATDIDPTCLARAQAGSYKSHLLADVPFSMRRKYLKEEGDVYTVTPEVKSLIEFRKHDLTGPMPEGLFEVIVCRNVVIYFTRELQEHLFTEFHRLLAPDGFLILGKTEVLLADCRYLYQIIDVGERVYRKREVEPPSANPGT